MVFRNRRVVRAVACFLLVETVGTIVAPCLSYAAMGPGQPEFTSYESPGSTDMVNMTTGDFTYNIPVLDIPGPERSFSLPLTYRAGIRLEQEASWVGLGWSLNPGAIARSLNGYPDDAVNDPMTMTYKKNYAHGWTGGLPGVLDLAWDSNTGHSGTADLLGVASVGWANGKVQSGDLIGVKYTKGQGVSVDPVRMAFAAVTVASVGTAGGASAMAGEAAQQLGTSAATGAAASMILGKSGGTAGGFNRPITRKEKRFLHTNYWVFSNDNKKEMMYGSLYFQNMSLATQASTATLEDRHPPLYEDNVSKNKPKLFAYKRNYSTTVSETREVGADLQQYAGRADEDYYTTGLRPISIAHDDFSVMGEGVSGSIRPFRLEVGSLSLPKQMSEQHDKYNIVPYLNDYKVGFRYDNSISNSYDYHAYPAPSGVNAVGINADNNQNALVLKDPRLFAAGSGRTAPATRKGIVNGATRGLVQGKHVTWYSNAEIEGMFENQGNGKLAGSGFLEFENPQAKNVSKRVALVPVCSTCSSPATPTYAVKDNGSSASVMATTGPLAGDGTIDLTKVFKIGDKVHNYGTIARRYRITTPSGPRDIICNLNYEGDNTIASVANNSVTFLDPPLTRGQEDQQTCTAGSSTGSNNTYLGYDNFSTRLRWPYRDSTYTTKNPFRKLMPRGSIGAFSVTAEDGTTYHFSLPVYHYNQFSKSREINATQGEPSVSTQILGQEGRDYGYATTWLLTAVTSPDYVDRGTIGVIDADDWGGWVKFQYGRFAKRYKWRQPYIGEGYPEEDLDSSKPINTASYSEGSKETYYLNAIQTRTHTAFFVKSVRNDARGHFNQGIDSTLSSLGIDERAPSSSLRLDEIILLTNEEVAKLQQVDGIRAPGSPGAAVPALSYNTNGNSSVYDLAELKHGDSYQNVLDTHDLEVDSRIRQYINQRALKRIVFRYSYQLCPNTPSSFNLSALPSMTEAGMYTNRTGKLTLESLSTYGPQNTKLVPDFVFTYGPNPAYSKEKWDGFGMYNRSGQYGKTSHDVSTDVATATQDGAAWSLTSILTPLGSTTRIQYERDQYSSVSQYGNGSYNMTGQGGPGDEITGNNTVDLTQVYRRGETVHNKGILVYRYRINTNSGPRDINCNVPYEEDDVISSVTSNSLTFQGRPAPPTYDLSPCYPSGTTIQETGYFIGYGGFTTTIRVPENRNGGDIRVAAVQTVAEDAMTYTVKYKYVRQHGVANNNNSSGVISKLPEFIPRTEYPFYSWFDYPTTSVLYGKVHVLRGTFKNNDETDFEQREEYSFFTPTSTMIAQQEQNVRTNLSNAQQWTLDRQNNTTTVDVGTIGQPIAIRRYNRSGQQEFASTFTYASAIPNADGVAKQGYFTEGVLTTELLDQKKYRINRSTKQYIPTLMTGTSTLANGVQVASTSSLFDFYTGQPLETISKNSLGDTYRSKTVPAYTLTPYASMGPRTLGDGNSQMLTQEAASYTFKQSGSAPEKLVAAATQTWKNDWTTYRLFDPATSLYRDATPVESERSVWRQHASYVWNDARLNEDGTYTNFVDFDWTQPGAANQHPGWLKSGEVTRYDHNSKLLEAQDVNGLYSSRKLGHNQSQVLATGANARHTEIAYSGAEDRVTFRLSSEVHFGGEVADGGRQDALYAHSGLYSSKLARNEQGFTYKAKVGTDVVVGRAYRLSAWVHKSDVAGAGRLVASLNGTSLGQTSASASTTKKAGDWYLLNLYLTLPGDAAGKTLTVGCLNQEGVNPVYFDDFRFQPVDGPMTAYVYDPATWQLAYVLNNDNLFTRFEYDAAGKLMKVYKETLDRPNDICPVGGKLVKAYQYNYARGLQ